MVFAVSVSKPRISAWESRHFNQVRWMSDNENTPWRQRCLGFFTYLKLTIWPSIVFVQNYKYIQTREYTIRRMEETKDEGKRKRGERE